MSTLLVQEHHLWLNLAEIRDADKIHFLDSPISQAGLFGGAVENFTQQFSAVQQQTEPIKHILPRRDAAAIIRLSGMIPPPARRRGWPLHQLHLAATAAVFTQAATSSSPQEGDAACLGQRATQRVLSNPSLLLSPTGRMMQFEDATPSHASLATPIQFARCPQRFSRDMEHGALPPQPSVASGQLGKEQTPPRADRANDWLP